MCAGVCVHVSVCVYVCLHVNVSVCVCVCVCLHVCVSVCIQMDLQLYQIDQQTYLLDFKNLLPNMEVATMVTAQSEEDRGDESPRRHLTMEFFEMCAQVISALAQ